MCNLYRVNKETIQWIKDVSMEKCCNYALTINPNNEKLSMAAIESKLRMIERRVKSICYKNKHKREEFFFIAIFEHSYIGSYHLHLVLRIPDRTELSFTKYVAKSIKSMFPKASYQLDAIYDSKGWLDYITKKQFNNELLDNFCLSNRE